MNDKTAADIENIADQILDLEDDLADRDTQIERLTEVLETLAMAALESGSVPVNRIQDDEYIYDTLGSQLGSATTDALALLRRESVSA